MTAPTHQRPLRIRRGLRRVAAHATYGVATAPLRARTWYDVRIRHRHEVHAVVAATSHWAPHVAVVAVFPRRALVPSVLRLLRALRELGSTVVLVANESPDAEWCLQQWHDTADVMLRRPNIGRDFGAYQAAVRFVAEHAGGGAVERLSFFNDSVVYLQPPTSALAWLVHADDCASFTVNARPRPHLQSYAFSLPGGVAFGPGLSAFWRGYAPTNLRHEVVRRGELALSDELREQGRPLHGFASAERLGTALGAVAGAWGEALSAGERRSVAWALALDPSRAGASMVSVGDGAAGDVPAFDAVNPTHAFGLVSARVLALPVKADLVRVGAATLDDVRELLAQSGTPDEEAAGLLTVFAPDPEPRRLTRLWQGAGLW